MNELQVIPLPAFSDNYFWLLINSESNAAAIVDPGDAVPVESALAAHGGLRLETIVITHHHLDHTGGVDALLAAHEGVEICGPQSAQIPQVRVPLRDGDIAHFLGLDWQVLAVPGHTLDHIAYYQAQHGLLFCGDTLFAGGCGRLFEGSPEMMLTSLGKLAALPAATKVYCAHEYTLANLRFARAVEPDNRELARRWERDAKLREENRPTVPSTIGEELATNPFLRSDHPSVIACARAVTGQRQLDSAQVFAAIRGWKDNF